MLIRKMHASNEIYIDFSLLSDLNKPTFNTSSQIQISVAEGNYLSVECTARSYPRAEYRWTNSSGAIVSAMRTLVFQTIQRSEANTYTCIAINAAGLEANSSLIVAAQCELECYQCVIMIVLVYFEIRLVDQ